MTTTDLTASDLTRLLEPYHGAEPAPVRQVELAKRLLWLRRRVVVECFGGVRSVTVEFGEERTAA